MITGGQDLCPACRQMMDPELKNEKFIVSRLVETTTDQRQELKMEVFGGLYV